MALTAYTMQAMLPNLQQLASLRLSGIFLSDAGDHFSELAQLSSLDMNSTYAPSFPYATLTALTKLKRFGAPNCLLSAESFACIGALHSLEELIARSQLITGLLNVQSLHTTAAIIVNECEPLLLEDFESLLQKVAPRDVAYRHDDEAARTVNLSPGERPNGWSHCRALMLGASACLNVVDGRLVLGRWQRVFLVELDGPRSRDVSVLLIGETAQ